MCMRNYRDDSFPSFVGTMPRSFPVSIMVTTAIAALVVQRTRLGNFSVRMYGYSCVCIPGHTGTDTAITVRVVLGLWEALEATTYPGKRTGRLLGHLHLQCPGQSPRLDPESLRYNSPTRADVPDKVDPGSFCCDESRKQIIMSTFNQKYHGIYLI